MPGGSTTGVDRVEVSTAVYLPPAEVYEFLIDFPGYARYSEYLEEVSQRGDGASGTEYALTFAWWKLTYTARTEVVDVEPPERIDWAVRDDLDASGYWHVEPAPEAAPPERSTASRVRLTVEYDAASAGPGLVDLPRFVSLGRVVEKAKPLVEKEARRVVERIVADLEGEPREVDLDIEASDDAI